MARTSDRHTGYAPPQDQAAEEHVLGALLLGTRVHERIQPILTANDFYRHTHALIYQATLALTNQGIPADPITLSDELERRGHLQEVGGRPRIHELAALVPAAGNAPHYARIVRERARERRALTALSEAAQRLLDRDGDLDQILDATRAALEQPAQEITSDHSWQTEPLDTDDDQEQEPQRILGLFYPQLRHLVYGEPESLKTWLALCAVAEVVKAGGRALWIDHEMSARVIRSRLRNLGCDKDARARVTYIRPSSALDERSQPYLQQLLDQEQPQIAVVDAYTGALGLAMLDDNSNIDVERWNQTIGALLWGPEKRCLVILDHVNKDKDSRGRWSSGSKRKLEGADVAYSMEMVKRLGRQPGQDGKAKITAHKDRPAWLPSMRPGDLELHVQDDGRIAYLISPVVVTSEPGDDGAQFRPTGYMQKVSMRLELHGEPASRTWTERNVTGKAEYIRQAIDVLLNEGYLAVREAPNRTQLLTVQRPFREESDASPSQSVPVRPDSVPDGVHASPSHPVPPRSGDGVNGTDTAGGQDGHYPVPGSDAWLGQAPLDEIHAWDSRQRDPA